MCEAIDIKGNRDENRYESITGADEVALIGVWDFLELPPYWCSECGVSFQQLADAAAHVGLTPAEIEA